MTAGLPTFTVIIPTYGRPQALVRCLDALAELDYPRELFDVIAVEDGVSPKPILPEDVAPFEQRMNFKLLRQEHAGPAAARNLGAQLATGEYLAFTDDDCRPDAGWLRKFAAEFERTPRAMLGGHTENAVTDNPYSAASQVLLSYIYEYFIEAGAPFFASNNIAVSKLVFEQVEGFDLRFAGAGGEDRGFCDQCLHQGIELFFVAGAIVQHYHALSAKRFFRQHYNYGRGAFVYHTSRAERGAGEVEVEPLAFYWNLLRYPRTLEASKRPRFGSTLMFVSQVANVTGYFSERFSPLRKEPLPGALPGSTEQHG